MEQLLISNLTFSDFIFYLSYASLFLMAIEIYLSLNKLWRRKHEKAVAESISLSAKFISLFPIVTFTISFYIDNKIPAFAGNTMLISFIIIQIMIGSGLWINGQKI